MSIQSSFARNRIGGWVESARTLSPAAQAWTKNVISLEGTYSDRSVFVADGVVRDLIASGLYSEFTYLLLFLGSGRDSLRTATYPIIDTLGVGFTGNAGPFVGSTDHSESSGLTSTGGKTLDTKIKAGQLGTGGNGGLGFWALAVDFTGATSEVCGAYNNALNQVYAIDLRNTVKRFWWSAGAGVTDSAGSAPAGHYYGQRTSATARELFLDGASIATSAVSDSASGVNDKTIYIFGINGGSTSKGRSGLFYGTKGTFTAPQVATVDDIFRYWMRKLRRI